MNGYLIREEVRELRRIVLDLTRGDYGQFRGALLGGLPDGFRANLRREAVDSVQLASDLTAINESDRIAGGLIPLAQFLDELVDLFADSDQALVGRARQLLAKVEQDAVGAPDVAPPTTSEVKEAIVHQNDLLPASYVRGAQLASQSVAKLEVPRFLNGSADKGADGLQKTFLGTGWLVGDGLLITNDHVISARLKGEPPASEDDVSQQVANMRVIFDFDDIEVKPPALGVTSLVAKDPALDFALLRIASDRPSLAISSELPEAPKGHGSPALNIIQHPGGNPKAFGIRNNLMASATQTDVRYFTDTQSGSSGAPVFDDTWRAVALHRGHTYASGVEFQGREAMYLNVGTRMSAILQHLRAQHSGQLPELGI